MVDARFTIKSKIRKMLIVMLMKVVYASEKQTCNREMESQTGRQTGRRGRGRTETGNQNQTEGQTEEKIDRQKSKTEG